MTTEPGTAHPGSIYEQPNCGIIQIRINLERNTDTSGETWISHCLELDAVSQGGTPRDALESIAEAIDMMVSDEIAALESSGQIYKPAWERAFTNIAEHVAAREATRSMSTSEKLGFVSLISDPAASVLATAHVPEVPARNIESGEMLPCPGQIAYASADPDPMELQRRLAKVLWREVAKASNPWFNAAASGSNDYHTLWEKWNCRQLELTRSLFTVVFGNAAPTGALLAEALNFMGSQQG